MKHTAGHELQCKNPLPLRKITERHDTMRYLSLRVQTLRCIRPAVQMTTKVATVHGGGSRLCDLGIEVGVTFLNSPTQHR